MIVPPAHTRASNHHRTSFGSASIPGLSLSPSAFTIEDSRSNTSSSVYFDIRSERIYRTMYGWNWPRSTLMQLFSKMPFLYESPDLEPATSFDAECTSRGWFPDCHSKPPCSTCLVASLPGIGDSGLSGSAPTPQGHSASELEMLRPTTVSPLLLAAEPSIPGSPPLSAHSPQATSSTPFSTSPPIEISNKAIPMTPKLTTSKSHLQNMPPELLLEIATYLPPSAQVALKLTSRYFFIITPLTFKAYDLDTCARNAIRWHIEEARGARGMGASRSQRFRCKLCKALYPRSLFEKSALLEPDVNVSGLRDEVGDGDAGTVARTGESVRKPEECRTGRICYWHLHRFVKRQRSKSTESSSPNLTAGVLRDTTSLSASASTSTMDATQGSTPTPMDVITTQSRIERVCMHCGSFVKPFADCGCGCESCGIRDVRCWTIVEGMA